MGLACSVCSLAVAGTVNDLLASGRSARSVAAEFGISYDALTRHARNHLTRGQVPAHVPASLDPLDELTSALRVRALAGNPSDTREYRLALQAQAAARHAAIPDRDLAATDEWIALRAVILRTLQPFPEAGLAIATALEDMD